MIWAIFIAEKARAPMQDIDTAELIEGSGIQGDRYATRSGTFSTKTDKVRHVTIISREAFLNANEGYTDEEKFSFADARRNVVVSVGVDILNRLVGKEFTLGHAIVKGTELCAPCNHPSKLAGKSDFDKRFTNAGGIRVAVLQGGLLRPSWHLIANI